MSSSVKLWEPIKVKALSGAFWPHIGSTTKLLKNIFYEYFECFYENQKCYNPHGFSCLPQKNDYNMVYKNVNVFIKKYKI